MGLRVLSVSRLLPSEVWAKRTLFDSPPRGSTTRFPKRICRFLVFCAFDSFMRKTFLYVSTNSLRSCSPATKMRPIFTAPNLKRFGISTIFLTRLEAFYLASNRTKVAQIGERKA